MLRFPCLFVSWAILAVVAAPARAHPQQERSARPEPTAESIAEQLRVNDAKSVAWGGYLAGEQRRGDLVPRLIEALASPRLQQSGIEWSAARNAVLDALIQLKADPPADVLVRYYPHHREQVLILLSEPRPGRDDVLLTLLKTESGIPWYAMAGLLLEVKAGGLAAELVRGLQLTLDVTVVDGPPREGPRTFSGAGPAIGDGGLYPAPGFPSIATYSLWDSPVRGAIVLAQGPQPIYYTREASPPDSIPSGPSSLGIEGPDARNRLKYFEELVEHWLPVEAVEEITLKWTTAERLRTQVASHRARIVRQYREMLQLAQKANLLSLEEAKGLAPTIEVRLEDLRRNKSTRLPDVSR